MVDNTIDGLMVGNRGFMRKVFNITSDMQKLSHDMMYEIDPIKMVDGLTRMSVLYIRFRNLGK